MVADPSDAEPRTREDARTIAQRAADQLRDMIAAQVLGPGERLRERDLAARLEVSRTPLREALRLLEAEGLVDISVNRGAVVATLSMREVHDLLSILGALEALAGEQAVERASDEQIAEVRAIHHEMLAAFERRDRMAYFKHNQRIHHAIVAASANAPLIATYQRTNARLYRVRFESHARRVRWHGAIDSHHAILQALSARDGTALAALLREHQKQAWINLREQENGQ